MDLTTTPQPPRATTRRKDLGIAILKALVTLLGTLAVFFLLNRPVYAQSQDPSVGSANTNPQAIEKPRYHKKVSLYKRVVAPADMVSIRSSALSPGYKTLSGIPPAIIASQVSIRLPQYLPSTALSNYRSLSTLGTQLYFSNNNVQQLLTSLSNQQYLMELKNRIAMDITNRQFLNDYNNNLNFNSYVDNFNSLNNQQYLNNSNFNLDFQNYLNNFNNLNNQFLNPTNRFTNPTYIQPPSFNYQPPTFVQPPTFIQPPTFSQPPTFRWP